MKAVQYDPRGALGAALLIAALALGCAGSATKEQSTSVGGAGTATSAAPAAPETKAPETKPQTEESSMAAAGTMPVKPDVEPQHVQVQHILIGFTGSVGSKPITRTQEEAKTLAYQILERARKGEDFDALVRQYTDDSPPGIYSMCAVGVRPLPGEYPRDQMVPAFGNVGFAISPGNIGIADYDPSASPFGWHIIKRLK
jgi:hypothetical protein